MSWEMVPIGDFCRTGSGGTPSRRQAGRYYGGEIPWVKSGELREGVITKTEETITEEALSESSAKRIPQGALLVAMYGATVGRVAKLGIDATSNQAVCHIVPDELRANQHYLFYALQAQLPHWLGKRVGGAQPNISQAIIRDTRIPLPPLPEQKRIAAILDKADSIRCKRQETITLTNKLIRSTFLNIFGDPTTNPKAWKQQELSQVATVFSGYAFKSSWFGDNGTPVIRIGDIQNGSLNIGNAARISPDHAPNDRHKIQTGDILMALSGATTGKIGAVDDSADGAWLNQRVAGIRAPTKYWSAYLECLLADKKLLNSLLRSAAGSAQANLSPKDLRALKLPIPDKESLLLYERLASTAARQQRTRSIALERNEELYSSLLQRAFQNQACV